MKKNKKKRRINWKKRFSNKLFLMSLISTVLLLITQLGLFPIPPDFEAIVNSVLTLLALGGVLTDPTTDGMWDSDMALSEEDSYTHDEMMCENAGKKFAQLNGLEDKLSEFGMSEYFNYAEYGRQQMQDGIMINENKQDNIPEG
jgi:phi LC3 family holin